MSDSVRETVTFRNGSRLKIPTGTNHVQERPEHVMRPTKSRRRIIDAARKVVYPMTFRAA